MRWHICESTLSFLVWIYIMGKCPLNLLTKTRTKLISILTKIGTTRKEYFNTIRNAFLFFINVSLHENIVDCCIHPNNFLFYFVLRFWCSKSDFRLTMSEYFLTFHTWGFLYVAMHIFRPKNWHLELLRFFICCLQTSYCRILLEWTWWSSGFTLSQIYFVDDTK